MFRQACYLGHNGGNMTLQEFGDGHESTATTVSLNLHQKRIILLHAQETLIYNLLSFLEQNQRRISLDLVIVA